MYSFPAIFDFVENEVLVYFPDLPGCNTFGKTEKQALEMAKDALAITIFTRLEQQEPIPNPTPIGEVYLKKDQEIKNISVGPEDFSKFLER